MMDVKEPEVPPAGLQSQRASAPEPDFHYPIQALRQPHAVTTVRLRALVNRMLAANSLGRGRLAVVGAEKGVGRSFVAVNLALLFAQAGARTLLIDADFRNPSIHKTFHIEDRPGFCEAIAGATGTPNAADDGVRAALEVEGLYILPAGGARSEAPELYGWRRLGACLDRLAQGFDWIVIDCPSARDEGEAQAVAARAGTALLVTRRNVSRLAVTRRFVEGLRGTGVEIIGGLLNEN